MNWDLDLSLEADLDPGTITETINIRLDSSRNVLDYFKVVVESLQSEETVTNIDIPLNQIEHNANDFSTNMDAVTI